MSSLRSINNLLIVVLLALFVALQLGIIDNYKKNRRAYLNEHSQDLFQKYRSVMESYRLMTTTLFEEMINRPEITQILAKVLESKEKSTREALRRKLIEKLRPSYSRLKQRNIRQLHFHLPEAISFIRFHRLNKHGDSLWNVRYTIKRANINKEYVHGFEEGRIFNGFRNVFPIFHQSKFVGTVEISLSYAAITQATTSLFPAHYSFLIAKDLITRKVWKDEQSNYRVSDLNPDYYYDAEFLQEMSKIPNIVEINSILASDSGVVEAFKEGKRKSFYITLRGEHFVISLLPIINAEGNHAAFLVSYSKGDRMARLFMDMIIQTILAAISFILVLLFFIYRKNQMGKVMEREELFRATIKSAKDAIVVFDRDGKVITWNERAVALFGHRYDEVAHSDFRQHVIPLEHQQIFRDFDLVQAGLGHAEIKIINKNGDSIDVEVALSIVNRRDDKKLMVAIFRDMSKRKAMEKVQKEQNEMLIQQSKLASMGEMIGLVAHQWKQPIHAIYLCSSDLETVAEKLPQQHTELVDIGHELKRQVEFMRATIDDFSNFFHPQKSREIFSIKTSIKNAIHLIAGQINNSGVAIDIVAKENLELKGQQNEFKQVIINLIINAIDAFNKRGIKDPSIKFLINRDENHVLIDVTDNAGGIPDELLSHVFTPYTSGKKDKAGSGIGLYLCKIIIEESFKGEIWVENINGGATFHLKIPRNRT